MRRYRERVAAASEARDDQRTYQRWLRSLTPEHRTRHEEFPGWPCGICMEAAMARMREAFAPIREMMAKMTDRDEMHRQTRAAIARSNATLPEAMRQAGWGATTRR